MTESTQGENMAVNNIQNVNTEGQGKRQKNEVAIYDEVTRLCPISYKQLVARISFKMHLSPDTVKYSFLSVLFNIGYITNDKYDIVYLKGTEQVEQKKNPNTNRK